MTTAGCSHALSWPKALLASGPFKFRCRRCSALVFRQHPLAARLFKLVNVDGIGITVTLVLLAAIVFLPWVAGTFAIAAFAAYLWDLKQQPIIACSETDGGRHQRADVAVLVALIAILSILMLGILRGP